MAKVTITVTYKSGRTEKHVFNRDTDKACVKFLSDIEAARSSGAVTSIDVKRERQI